MIKKSHPWGQVQVLLNWLVSSANSSKAEKCMQCSLLMIRFVNFKNWEDRYYLIPSQNAKTEEMALSLKAIEELFCHQVRRLVHEQCWCHVTAAQASGVGGTPWGLGILIGSVCLACTEPMLGQCWTHSVVACAMMPALGRQRQKEQLFSATQKVLGQQTAGGVCQLTVLSV